jgi:hypothetical protein
VAPVAAAVEPRHTFVRSVGHQEDTQRWHEVGFSVVEDRQPASGIVDLLYRVGGTWKIAEFKADEPRPGADLGAHIQREGYARRCGDTRAPSASSWRWRWKQISFS